MRARDISTLILRIWRGTERVLIGFCFDTWFYLSLDLQIHRSIQNVIHQSRVRRSNATEMTLVACNMSNASVNVLQTSRHCGRE